MGRLSLYWDTDDDVKDIRGYCIRKLCHALNTLKSTLNALVTYLSKFK